MGIERPPGRIRRRYKPRPKTIMPCVTQALETNPYVVIVALDFSKAFDAVSK